MTTTSAKEQVKDDRLHFLDVEQRLKAIFIGWVGNLVAAIGRHE